MPDDRPGRTSAGRLPVRRRRRWWVGWIVWPVVVAAVVALEFVLLGDRIGADVALVLAGPAAPAAAPAADPLPPLPAPADPAAAGPVRAVDLRTLPGCAAGRDCLVRIQILVDPGSVAAVDWTVRAEDLCTGTGGQVAAGTTVVPPGGRADVVTTVPVPAAAASALVATTTAPARAAADPIRVPGGAGCPA